MSTYPASVPGFYAGLNLGTSPYGQFAFEWGGYQYYFGLSMFGGSFGPVGDLKIHAMQSADAGATWTELDAANAAAPTLLAGGSGAYYTMIRDESTVLVLWVRYHSTGGGHFAIDGVTTETFDLLTGTWDAAPVDFVSPLPDGPVNSPFTSVQLLLRGHNDYVLFYQGPREVIGLNHWVRAYYATFDGTTWGAPTILPNQAGVNVNGYPLPACVDSSRIVHFAYSVGVAGFGAPITHVGLDTSNAFGTPSLITGDDYAVTFPGAEAPLMLVRDDTPERLGFACQTYDGADQAMTFFYADAVLNPASWTAVVITGDPAVQMNYGTILDGYPQIISLGCHDGNLICVWSVGAGHFDPWWWYYSTAPTGTLSWSTPAILTSKPAFPGPATDWRAVVVYATGDQVFYTDGLQYESKVNGNLNHQPDISPTQWDNKISSFAYPAQVVTYESATGIGLILVWDSNDDNILAEFYLFTFSPTPPASGASNYGIVS